jgi:two-component system chemotaxis response regulator CheY
MLALVVDDSRATRSMLRKMLAQLGFDVVEAGHGVEALERLSTLDHVDFALVDWNMPEMDGLELVRALRAERRHAELPVMMVTAESDATQMARALMAGADEYALKPLDLESLETKLNLLGVLEPATCPTEAPLADATSRQDERQPATCER